ncbi:PQQ-dependent sugar dehydrogenase [Flavobacterium coralii]|uniref:PQQ-dependent sugar dehydrogenase n=1 Tax=Flavobacterium coralii TaxID=2838017 RepID=UPI000C3896A4|nr:cadherin [Flavobacterium sp.]|tara:strand:- start:4361 stop:5731 length:1371 start_codon:yes stop_codon:yes gene_type:complete
MKKTLLLAFTMAGTFAYGQQVGLELFASGVSEPTEMVHAGDSRLFVTEQGGLIKILNADGTINATPFLNVSSLLASAGGERGLLGLAFHPDYANNGYFFINYTNTSGDTVIARYTVSEDENVADASSAIILLTIDQPFSNHNGGCLRFGPDGYLYISMGDGGSGGDPNNYAQNKESLLGKMLRIDVNGDLPYTIPLNNPFLDTEGADEIWAYGLRNAWKFSFNRNNGDVWIADVGQGQVEEINKVDPAGPVFNFGWRCFEGSQTYNSEGCSLVEMYTNPVAEYFHDDTDGCSVTGGYVYTGDTYPALQGKYLFADYCNNQIGIVDDNFDITWSDVYEGNFFTTFGEDINGELYIAGGVSGNIYKIIGGTMSLPETDGSAFSLYPNPATDVVTVKSGNDINLTAAAVYDLSGKLLMQQQFSVSSENTVSVGNLPAGIYLMQLTGSNGNVYSHKLSVK